MPITVMSRSFGALEKAQRIGLEIAAPAADSVDREARFPSESFEALRAERMLGIFIPTEFGGGGCSIADVSAICTALGQHCSATAMIFAMHQIQVACIVRHARESEFFASYLAELADTQSLIASATSEIGVGGDTRSSVCAIERDSGSFSIKKQAPVISYGEYADAILATARRTPDSPPSDQVLVLLKRDEFTLARTSGWDTLGFRGTCSPGFMLTARATEDHILTDSFADISSQTMLPVSHIVWTSLWLGIATAAVGRARAYIRAEARKSPGKTPAASVRLAEVVSKLQGMRALVNDSVRDYEATGGEADAASGMNFAIRMNNLKLSCSTAVVDIVSQSMLICGMSGYRIDSKFSLGRLLRDAYGAALMINNDRIYGANAAMLLVSKDD
ncbi:MAG TPA: acyl-CoA dehydrogenase family protein [Gemmatimonadaceae bacterium]|nr:acyl-CoA dehydrogenase family protein [Gemmatimonadaceae bacterium]